VNALPNASSAHGLYRERIATLLTLATIGPIGGASAPGWSIHTARFQPGRASWATVVQQGPGRALLQTAKLYDERSTAPDCCVHTRAGPALVTTFPADDELPALDRLVASIDDPDIVRYRPGSRCTVRATAPAGVRWLKVFAGGVSRQLASDAVARWQAADRGELAFRVAEPVSVDVASSAEWQSAVPGRPIATALRGLGAAGLGRRLGTALTTLNRSSLVPSRSTAREDQIARMERGVHRLARTVPDLAVEVGARLRRLSDSATDLPGPRRVPIHGSPHEHQWLMDGDGQLGLVDFDRWGYGEPELDAATFLGELYFERNLRVDIGEIEEAMIEGFRDGGVPLDDRVLDWYLSHKLLTKVVRTTTALRIDGDERAWRHLATVDTILAKR
jgi:hypothetical protein